MLPYNTLKTDKSYQNGIKISSNIMSGPLSYIPTLTAILIALAFIEARMGLLRSGYPILFMMRN